MVLFSSTKVFNPFNHEQLYYRRALGSKYFRFTTFWRFRLHIRPDKLLKLWNILAHRPASWEHLNFYNKVVSGLISSKKDEKIFSKDGIRSKSYRKREEPLLPANLAINGVESLLIIMLSNFFWSSRPLSPNWINSDCRWLAHIFLIAIGMDLKVPLKSEKVPERLKS